MLKRILYLGYYFKEMDWKRLRKFMKFAARQTGKSRLCLWAESIHSSLTYNISILEYYMFRFYEIDKTEKSTFAGTGYMYEYQKRMNPLPHRKILEDKRLFLKSYKEFVRHQFASIEDKELTLKITELLNNPSGKMVLKSSNGQCGIGVEVKNTTDFTEESLVQYLKDTDNDMVEEFVVQHKYLQELSPSGLNTVRIITQLDKNNKVVILGVRLRITVNSVVDNLAAGNLAAPVNNKTGIVEGPGVYSDITKEDAYEHPVTNVKIVGFEIPFWNETLQMIEKAALLHPENRSIGWDVAITDNGPELIEANHDWCKLLWQLPIKKGLKPILEKYKQELLTT